MTPPDSPDKAGARTSDFHPMIDVRGPPLTFDVRRGMHLSGGAASQAALGRPAARLLLDVGPGLFSVEVVPLNGAAITLGDVFGALTQAVGQRASSAEVANAVRLGFTNPAAVKSHASRGAILHAKVMFSGLTLRSVQGSVVYADCHLC